MEDNSDHFPINRLRNVAIHNTITNHFWLTDVDIWSACHSPSLFLPIADLYETILSLPSTSKPSLFLSMRWYPSMSNWSALLTIAREYRLEVAIVPICRHVSSSMWSVRVRHRHLYAVPHHREELMSCLQFGPCEQFKKNRKTHVHFQQCIHQLVLHQLRAMGEDDKSIQVPLRCGMLQEWGLWTLCRGEAWTSTAYPFHQYESNSFTEPWFDEQYVDCGMNKLIWIFRLRVADYRFRVLHSLSMFLIRDESHLFQWWIGWHCPRTWTWYERRMVVLRKWTTTWGRSLWAWRREGIEDTSPVV